MDTSKDSHNNVFLAGLQTLSQLIIDTQPIEIDGRSLDVPTVVAIARYTRKLLPAVNRG